MIDTKEPKKPDYDRLMSAHDTFCDDPACQKVYHAVLDRAIWLESQLDTLRKPTKERPEGFPDQPPGVYLKRQWPELVDYILALESLYAPR